MKKMQLAAIGLAMTMLTSGAASAMTKPMKISTIDKRMINSCMMMSHEDMMKNDGCRLMMKKMKLSGDDMSVLSACKAMARHEMLKDKQCAALDATYPNIFS